MFVYVEWKKGLLHGPSVRIFVCLYVCRLQLFFLLRLCKCDHTHLHHCHRKQFLCQLRCKLSRLWWNPTDPCHHPDVRSQSLTIGWLVYVVTANPIDLTCVSSWWCSDIDNDITYFNSGRNIFWSNSFPDIFHNKYRIYEIIVWKRWFWYEILLLLLMFLSGPSHPLDSMRSIVSNQPDLNRLGGKCACVQLWYFYIVYDTLSCMYVCMYVCMYMGSRNQVGIDY